MDRLGANYAHPADRQHWNTLVTALRTFARKFSNTDFFLKNLPLKVDELVMSEM